MSLVAKIGSVLAAAFTTFLVIQYYNHHYLVSERLAELEKDFIQRELVHNQHLLQSHEQQLKAILLDWAIWDDSFEFLNEYNESFVLNNQDIESLVNINVDSMIWINRQNLLHYGIFLDQNRTASDSLLSEFLVQHGDILSFSDTRSENTQRSLSSGLLVYNGDIYIMAKTEVLKSSGNGPSPGWLIMARRLPETLFARQQTQLDTLSHLKPAEFYTSDLLSEVQQDKELTYHFGEDRVNVYLPLTDIYGKPSIVLSSDMPRTIMQQRQKDFTTLFTIEIGVSFFVALIAFYYLRRNISSPISKLIREIEQAPSLDRVRISESPNQSEEVRTLIAILKDAISQLNFNLVQEKANQARVEQQNRILFDLANDKDLTEGHLHQSFYKILSTLINQTQFQRASIWIMDKNLDSSECYACYSLQGDNIETGSRIGHNQLTKSILQKLTRQRSFVTKLNTQTTEAILDTKVYEQAVICPIMLSNEIAGALITEFTEEQEAKVQASQLFLASLSELCSNSLYAHERRQLHDQLNHMAHHDPLTKLPNRSLFEEIAIKSMARAKREHKGFGILFVDLDKFKPVNDQYGHAVGDELLVGIAERLKQRLRATDTIARIGGDEFLILLESTGDISDARIIATQIIESISIPFEIQDHHVRVGCSIGIAIYPHHGTSLEQLISASDHAMYEVKDAARGGIAVAKEVIKAS